MKKWFFGVLLAAVLACAPALAEEFTVWAQLPVTGGVVEIKSRIIEDEPWLFLPAHADLSALTLALPDGWTVEDAEGPTVDWLSIADEDENVYSATLVLGEEDSIRLYIMRSENIRALYLFSADPVNQGREWLESAPKHENEATGRMALVNADGVVDHADQLRQLRGRGNWTWGFAKRPYQFKLETRADLLKTGLPEEKQRTWVLLADALDPTLLHNRVSMDLGLEMGMSETSRSEHVDLYYDGDYRGTYLLCEKVEVDTGRIDVLDYDELLERWNKRIGQNNLEALDVAEDVNRFGNRFSYNAGVIADKDVKAGGYLIEMESPTTMSERCWFYLSDGRQYSFKNPENPNHEMALYASELLQEGLTAIEHGGVHPETGKTIADYFDLESFAKLALMAEVSSNVDAFRFSSTFFILPEGETRFRAGPIWDCDLAWRYRRNAVNDNGAGLTSQGGWLEKLYACDLFRQELMRQMPVMEHLINDVLLGGEAGEHLRSIDAYAGEIAASSRMNQKIWQPAYNIEVMYASTAQQDLALFKSFAGERVAWLSDTLGRWQEGGELALRLTVVYANTESTQQLSAHDPWEQIGVRSLGTMQFTDADEERYALWRTDVELECAVEEGTILTVNGVEIPYETVEDGVIAFSFLMEDETYRPVDYYGEDIGMVYDPAYYAANYPEVVEEYGDDPEALMDAFYYDGMAEGHQGNEAFSPREIQQWLVTPNQLYGDDWSMYYLEYMGEFSADWMLEMDKRYQPAVHAAEE